MSDTPPPRVATKPVLLWLSLFSVSLLAGAALVWLDVPAAFFVGAVLCGLTFSLSGSGLKLPRRFFFCAQALVGCSVAKSMSPEIFGVLAANWLVFAGMVSSSVVAGGLVGWCMTRFHILPGNTAAWGSSPGGAAAMVAMAESFGADARLVAMMQYLRVLVVVLSASMVAHWLAVPQPVASVASSPWSFAALVQGQPVQIALTLAIAIVATLIAVRLRIPAGPLLATMIVGAVLNSASVVEFRLPNAFQIGASVLVGWYVGLGFNRALLIATLRKLHWLFFSAFLLIGLCGFFAWSLYHFSHCDPLTAYLATTPGGLDSVILLAMGANTDVPFVVAAQTLRLFLVILTGPFVARLICRFA